MKAERPWAGPWYWRVAWLDVTTWQQTGQLIAVLVRTPLADMT